MGWTADSSEVLGDSTIYTADGGQVVASLESPYTALIASPHNQKPNFMDLVTVVTGSLAEIAAGIRAIQPAFDLDQAIGAQLDVIGKWAGQSRVIPDVLTIGYFGFQDNPAAAQFGEVSDASIGGRLYNVSEQFTSTTVLGDPDYLTVLRARIVRNQSHGTLADIEAALEFIFGAQCSVADTGTYTLNLNVSTPITPTEKALLGQLDLLPRPAGIAIGTITYNP